MGTGAIGAGTDAATLVTRHRSAPRRWIALAGAVLIGAVLVLAATGGSGGGRSGGSAAGYAALAGLTTDDERAVAVGMLLDTPRSPEVVERSLDVAERLRRRYDIDTGNPVADRETAARRVQTEFLDRLIFEEGEIAAMAVDLGYSLDPEQCANYCDNVRELATVELKRAALEAFADGRAWPGRLVEESAVDPLEREAASESGDGSG